MIRPSSFAPIRPRASAAVRSGEQFCRLLKGALQTPWTKIILPPLHKRSLKLDRQNLLENRYVFVKELFLKIDRMRGYDRFLLLFEREKNGRR